MHTATRPMYGTPTLLFGDNEEELRPWASEAIFSNEKFWWSKIGLLESKGYTLRSRSRPDSPLRSPRPGPKRVYRGCLQGLHWTVADLRFMEVTVFSLSVTDAIRVSDGSRVFLKEASARPRHPTVPILDVFVSDKDTDASYLVMPLLRCDHMYHHLSGYVNNAIEFVDQVIKGLHFMHKME